MEGTRPKIVPSAYNALILCRHFYRNYQNVSLKRLYTYLGGKIDSIPFPSHMEVVERDDCGPGTGPARITRSSENPFTFQVSARLYMQKWKRSVSSNQVVHSCEYSCGQYPIIKPHRHHVFCHLYDLVGAILS